MATAHTPSYPIPKDLPSVLKGFVREVTRTQPQENLYEFGVRYFAGLMEARAAEAAEKPGDRRLSPDELRELLEKMFIEADSIRLEHEVDRGVVTGAEDLPGQAKTAAVGAAAAE